MDVYINKAHLNPGLQEHVRFPDVRRVGFVPAEKGGVATIAVEADLVPRRLLDDVSVRSSASGEGVRLDYKSGRRILVEGRFGSDALPYAFSATSWEPDYVALRVGHPFVEDEIAPPVELGVPLSAVSVSVEGKDSLAVLQCHSRSIYALDAVMRSLGLERQRLGEDEVLFKSGRGVNALVISEDSNRDFLKNKMSEVYDRQALLAGSPDHGAFKWWVECLEAEQVVSRKGRPFKEQA